VACPVRDALRVHVERREESKTEDKGSYRSEFRHESFTRVVPMPAGATEKDVKATYKDGILELRVPGVVGLVRLGWRRR
jgi:HSP20 family protein